MLYMNAEEPVYVQLCRHLRAEIESGKIKPGEMLRSERRLAAEYGINRKTARMALKELQNQGYISIEPKIGAMVL